MSETCPFCHKTFKRLKAHLPRCKSAPVAMAAHATKDPSVATHQPDDVTTSKKVPSSSSLALSSPSVKTTKKSKKSSTKQIQKPSSSSSSSPSLLSASQPSSTTSTTKIGENTASLSSTTPSSSSSSPLIPTSKDIRRNLVDKIGSATESSSPSPPPSLSTSSPFPSASLPTSPTITKPRKQSLRAQIQASQLKPESERQMRTKASSLTLQSSPVLERARPDPLSSSPASGTEDLQSPVRSSSESDPQVTQTKVDHKPKHATKKRESHREKAKPSLNPQTTTPSLSQDPLRESLKDQKLYAPGSEGIHGDGRTSLWREREARSRTEGEERGEWPEIGQARPMAQESIGSDGDNTDRLYSKTSTLAHIRTTTTGQITEHLYPKSHTTGSVIVDLGQTATDPQSHNSLTVSLLAPVAQPVQLATTANPVLPNSNRLQANLLSLNRTDNKTSRPSPRSTFTSPTPSDVPHLPPPAPSSPQGVGAGTRRAVGRGIQSQTTIHSSRGAEQEARGGAAAMSEGTLGEVRLRALPGWLADRCPSNPREGAQILQKGWQWYYRKYVDVKRGGVGGVAMLLAGYCVLSYMWSYPHIKRDRWRRYH